MVVSAQELRMKNRSLSASPCFTLHSITTSATRARMGLPFNVRAAEGQSSRITMACSAEAAAWKNSAKGTKRSRAHSWEADESQIRG